MEHLNYYPARLSKGEKWYVLFRFRNPETGEWKSFKVYENINRFKDKREKEEHGKLLVDSINRALEDGFNPFTIISQVQKPKEEKEKVWNIQQAVLLFKQKLSEKGIEQSSVGIYNGTIKSFLKWTEDVGIQFNDINPLLKRL